MNLRHFTPKALLLALTLWAAPAGCSREASLPPEQLVERAAEDLAAFDFDAAYTTFGYAAAKTATGSVLWQQATYGKAVCAQNRQPSSPELVAEATGLYRAILEKAPDSPFAPRAILNIGRMAEIPYYYRAPTDLPAAREAYRKVIAQWPEDPIAGEATLRLAATYVMTYQVDDVRKGVAILEDYLAGHPKDPLASAMWQYLGDTYFSPLDEPAKSVAAYKHCDALGWTHEGRQGPVYWRVAMLAERSGDRDTAVSYYTKIIKETPTSGKAYEAQLALKRLGAPVPKIELAEAPAKAAEPMDTGSSAASTSAPSAAGGRP